MNDELSMLSATLSADPVGNVTIPAFKKPASLRGFALANILTGLVIWLAQFLWKTIFGELFMNAASWLTSIYIPDVYDVVSTTTLYYLQEGTAVLEAYLSFIILALIHPRRVVVVVHFPQTPRDSQRRIAVVDHGCGSAPLTCKRARYPPG